MKIADHYRGEQACISNIDGGLIRTPLPEKIATEARRALTQNDAFEAIIQSANVGILVSDPTLPDNPTVFVNPAFLRITGYSREEVLGRNCRFLQEGGTDPEVLAKLRAAMQEGRSFRGLLRNRRKDGTFFWNELVVDPVFDKSGELVNFVGIQNDVTARVEAQRAARESQERLQAILNNTTSLIFVKDLSGRFVLVNRQFQRQLCRGSTPAGRTDVDIFGAEAAAIFRAHDREVLSEGRPLEFEEKLTQADGQRTYISVRFPLRSASGVISGIGGISIDITLRKEMEADLQSSKARKAAVLEAALDAIIITDHAGGICETNPAAKAMFGYAATELLGKNLADLIAQPDVPGEGENRLFTQIGEHKELSALRKDGTEFPVELAITRIAVDGPAMFTGHIRDITRQRQIEATLLLAKEEAERANAAKNEFLSRMSHELRTPLNAILGFSQLLARRKLDERAAENVRHISQAGSHLLDLVTEVLDFSRIEVGGTSLSVEAVALGEILRASIDLVWNQAQARDITFHCDAATLAEIYVLADRQRLKQIFVNLLSNAVKYNRAGGSVTIDCKRADSSSPVRVSFRDTGDGISPEDLKRLFIPFERLMPDKSTIEGTGIGLAISQRLAKMMRGSIEVESIVAEGTTFTIVIPAGTRPAEVKISPAVLPAEAPAPAGQQAVLYIEDNPANLRLMEQIAEEHGGINLVTGTSGGAAVELAREVKPKLILLDLHLPDLFGDKILALLRADPEFIRTPIYIVSADAMNSQIKRLLKSGANGYLTKPIDVAQVMEVFDKHLAPIS